MGKACIANAPSFESVWHASQARRPRRTGGRGWSAPFARHRRWSLRSGTPAGAQTRQDGQTPARRSGDTRGGCPLTMRRRSCSSRSARIWRPGGRTVMAVGSGLSRHETCLERSHSIGDRWTPGDRWVVCRRLLGGRTDRQTDGEGVPQRENPSQQRQAQRQARQTYAWKRLTHGSGPRHRFRCGGCFAHRVPIDSINEMRILLMAAK
jgi:hypothetical protein